MKKSLLSMLTLAALCMPQAGAVVLVPGQKAPSRAHNALVQKSDKFVATQTPTSMMVTPQFAISPDAMAVGEAGELYTAIAPRDVDYTAAVAMYLSSEELALYQGNTITGIRFGNGPVASTSTVAAVEVFVTKDLNGEDLQTKSYSVTDGMFANWGEHDVEIDPIEITADMDQLYFGWRITMENSSGSYPLGVDYEYTRESFTGDFFGMPGDDGSWQWDNTGGWYGDFCVWALVEGDNLPVNDIAISNLNCTPIASLNKPFNIDFLLQNVASNDIETAKLSVKVGDSDAETVELTFDPVLSYKSYAMASLEVKSATVGANVPLTVSVLEVNGVEDTNSSNNEVSTAFLCLPEGAGYDRNVVIEEGTGTWCGFCVRGIVGMEYMKENYAADGRLIQIACHVGDAMEIENYQGFADQAFAGYPSALVDRYLDVDPNSEDLEAAYLQQLNMVSLANIELRAEAGEENEVILTSKTKFALDGDGYDYKIAYVVVEDGVGPYNQSNYYSGGGYGEMDGFENEGETVRLTFNDVAVAATDMLGLEGVFPSNVVAGEEYEDEAIMGVEGISEDDLKNNCRFVVMVINAENGQIVNAAQCTLGTSGISNVEVSEEAEAEYYNMQGLRVNPNDAVKGIFIKRQGGNSSKVVK